MAARGRKLAFVCLAVVASVTAGPAAPAEAAAAQVRNYDLGVVQVPDEGPKGPLPVRLWGAIAVPSGAGPHPLVVVAHGRHGDNCPDTDPRPFEFEFVWPCWAREQRNDLGMRHIVAALARHGVAAIAPDLNGAYTLGWGPDDDTRRWPRIINRTLAELRKTVREGDTRFGVTSPWRIGVARRGILGHSRSGHHGVRLTRRQSAVKSLFLLAPLYRGEGLPDIPTAIVQSACDADVPGDARRYFRDAVRRQRSRATFWIKLLHANHNYYNRTLSRLGRDDGRFSSAPGCRAAQRLRPRHQQSWIDKAAAAFFAATLDGGPRPAWMRQDRPDPDTLYRLSVVVDRLFP